MNSSICASELAKCIFDDVKEICCIGLDLKRFYNAQYNCLDFDVFLLLLLGKWVCWTFAHCLLLVACADANAMGRDRAHAPPHVRGLAHCMGLGKSKWAVGSRRMQFSIGIRHQAISNI